MTGEWGPGVSDQHQVVGDLGLRHPGLHPQLRVSGEAVHGDLATQRHQPLLNLAVALLKIKGLLFNAIFPHLENISMQFVNLYSIVQRFILSKDKSFHSIPKKNQRQYLHSSVANVMSINNTLLQFFLCNCIPI